MTVSVARLVAALRAQATELNSPTLAGAPGAVAQQLVYQSHVDPDLAALRPDAAARLAEVVAERRTLGLSTRWTTSRPRERLVAGHNEITALALAPDASFVVYATAGLVIARRSVTVAEAAPETLGTAEHWVTAVVMGPDGRSFVTGDRSGAVLAWRFAEGGVHTRLLGRHADYVSTVLIDPTTGTVYSSSDDGTVACCDDEGFRQLIRLPRQTSGLALDRAAGLLYTGDVSGAIRRWSLAGTGGELVGRQRGAIRTLLMVAGSVLLSTAWDGVVHAWWLGAPAEPAAVPESAALAAPPAASPESGAPTAPLAATPESAAPAAQAAPTPEFAAPTAQPAPTAEFAAPGTEPAASAEFTAPTAQPAASPESAAPAAEPAASPDSVAEAGELAPGVRHRVLGRGPKPLSGGFALDGTRLISADLDGRVLAWDVTGLAESAEAGDAESEPALLGRHDWGARCVSAAAGVVVSGGRDGFVFRWDGGRAQAQGAESAGVEIRGLVVTPDGSAVITGGADGVHRWAPLDADRPPRPRQLSKRPVLGVELVGGSELVAWNAEGVILAGAVTETEALLWPIVGSGREKSSGIRDLIAVPGSRAVVTSLRDGRILYRHLDRPGEPRLVGFHLAAAIAVAPDGDWLASVGDDHAVKRWDLREPGVPVQVGTVSSRSRALCVSADGEWVVTGDDHGEIRRCDASGTDPRTQRLGLHGETPGAPRLPTPVRSVAMPASGAWIASAADDGAVECRDPIGGASTSLLPVALPRLVAPVGERLLVSGRYGVLTLLDVLGASPSGSPAALGAAGVSGVSAGGGIGAIGSTGLPGDAGPEQADGPAELTLILDQVWCNQVRGGSRLDLSALRLALGAGRRTEALVPCPSIGALLRFRTFLTATGWTVVDVPEGREGQQAEVVALATRAVARGPVIVVSGEPAVVEPLAALPHRERLTIVDRVELWLEPGTSGR